MARKFLYFFAFCVVLFFAGRVVLSFYPEASTRLAFKPGIAFDDRQLGRVQRVEQGNGGVRIGAGVDDDAGILLACGLNQIDERALVVALGEFDTYPQPFGFRAACLLDVRKGFAAVNLRLSFAEHVEIRPIQHQDRLCGRMLPGGLCGQSCLPVLQKRRGL